LPRPPVRGPPCPQLPNKAGRGLFAPAPPSSMSLGEAAPLPHCARSPRSASARRRLAFLLAVKLSPPSFAQVSAVLEGSKVAYAPSANAALTGSALCGRRFYLRSGKEVI